MNDKMIKRVKFTLQSEHQKKIRSLSHIHTQQQPILNILMKNLCSKEAMYAPVHYIHIAFTWYITLIAP